MAKFLGIDYGLEKTGVSISDPEGKIAFPFGTFALSSYGSRKALLDDLAQKAQLAGVEAVVVGLPYHLDGTENLMCKRARNFAKRLSHRIDVPFYFVSEILTSHLAETALRENGLRRDVIESIVDQQAACFILQSFLDDKLLGESP